MGYEMSGPSLYPNLRRSTSGYRKGSDAYNDPRLVVPGDEHNTIISMEEENGDPLEKGNIKGTGLTTGKTIVMNPGNTYEFLEDEEVLEEPV